MFVKINKDRWINSDHVFKIERSQLTGGVTIYVFHGADKTTTLGSVDSKQDEYNDVLLAFGIVKPNA